VYHHASQQHRKRYLAEFDLRYNERQALGVSDSDRAVKALMGTEGKRLTYGGLERGEGARLRLPNRQRQQTLTAIRYTLRLENLNHYDTKY
jgi:hypothetical protein